MSVVTSKDIAAVKTRCFLFFSFLKFNLFSEQRSFRTTCQLAIRAVVLYVCIAYSGFKEILLYILFTDRLRSKSGY